MLFKLRDVPEDEAEGVREVLERNGIEFYETPASRWGISMEAIWLKDKAQLECARKLIDSYQRERVLRVRQEYARLKEEGGAETFLDRIKNHPFLLLIYLGMALLIGYVSTMPFLELGR